MTGLGAILYQPFNSGEDALAETLEGQGTKLPKELPIWFADRAHHSTPSSLPVALGKPRTDEVRKTREVIDVRQVIVHLIPVHSQILVNQDVAKPGDGGKLLGEVRRQDTQLTHAQDRLMVVARLLGAFERDDAVTDINAALRSHFKIALDDISQVGIAAEISLWSVAQGRQARQALAEFVQAPLDTAELDVHCPLLPGYPGAVPVRTADNPRNGS